MDTRPSWAFRKKRGGEIVVGENPLLVGELKS